MSTDLGMLLAQKEARYQNAAATLEEGLCVFCKLPAYERCYSRAGRKELGISGVCELCSDRVTREPEHASFPGGADGYADANGLMIVEPAANELQLDIDSKNVPQRFFDQLSILSQFETVIGFNITDSKSGNKHITVTLGRELGPVERIAFQATLGSDIKREILTLKSVKMGKPRPQFLYEKAAH